MGILGTTALELTSTNRQDTTRQFSAEDVLYYLCFTIILLGIQYSKTIAHGMCFPKLVSVLTQVVNYPSIPILPTSYNLACAKKKHQYSFLQLLSLHPAVNLSCIILLVSLEENMKQ